MHVSTPHYARYPLASLGVCEPRLWRGFGACSDVKRKEKTTIVEAILCTGKTHQLRLHFSSLGYPIIGDELYGKKSEDGILHLHSTELTFKHPITKEIKTIINLPKWNNNSK